MDLKNVKGEWTFDEKELRHGAIRFFENLYGEDPGSMRGLLTSLFPKLEDSEIQLLSKPVPNKEIKSTMFDMSPLKVSGSDRFHGLFFKVNGIVLGI
ncbi:LINE-1 reverse transcriptase [Gossypium arboreum]|uniref:LINE-1 reverse transcriptase n=1 Tax=Gossypium arboreum TaxID=29729 RepID=A0A0B0NDQ9_GOSAR|nr:LINE-1 reverse transcriptase [Gossypium arboreum]